MFIAATLIVGCVSFYQSVVTVTQVRKSVMNELGVLYRAGQISDDTDKQIEAADARFINACRALELGIAFGAATNSLRDVKIPVAELISILGDFSIRAANKHGDDLNKATQL